MTNIYIETPNEYCCLYYYYLIIIIIVVMTVIATTRYNLDGFEELKKTQKCSNKRTRWATSSTTIKLRY